ncbi:hypothetical protein DRN73_08765 [Candidatus Pacearchaeota archaeon]|nr:MAG: hypothetical protein DRN73_08765 [Candidatus Pacearchaeota archaeon]
MRPEEIIERLKRAYGKGIVNIVVLNEEGETLDKLGETNFNILVDTVATIGSVVGIVARKVGAGEPKYFRITTEEGREIWVIIIDGYMVGVEGMGLKGEALLRIIKGEEQWFEPTTDVEILLDREIQQLNFMIQEFSEGNPEPWVKFAYEHLVNYLPSLKDYIKMEKDRIYAIYPLALGITQKDIASAFRVLLEVMWKRGVEIYGAQKVREKLKKVLEKVK